ncbi:MAG: hypothetical protein V3U28_05170 [Candidatus Acidoferrales bacterium]
MEWQFGFFSLLIFPLFLVAAPDRASVEKELRQRYEQQVVRVAADLASYEGVNASIEGVFPQGMVHWAVNGYLVLHKIEVEEEKLKLQGVRRFMYLDRQGNLQTGTGFNRVWLHIRFPRENYGRAVELMDHFFELVDDDVLPEAVADCRRLQAKLAEQAGAPGANHAFVEPKCRHCPLPDFSRISLPGKRSFWTVSFWALVNEEGHIACLKSKTSSHPNLVSLADIIGTWEYEPALRNERAVEGVASISLSFDRLQ